MNIKSIILGVCMAVPMQLFADKLITVSTKTNDLVYSVSDDGRLYQRYFGKKLQNSSEYEKVRNEYEKVGNMPEAYITNGMEDYYEPALHIVHADGNPSTLLKYVTHTTTQAADGGQETVITLQDEVYKSEVKLHYVAYPDVDIIKEFTEITNRENKTVVLEKYASSMLHFNRQKYFLTHFNGDWISEANATELQLSFGKKIIDSKLGSRANMFASPFFQLAFDKPSEENSGDVLVGTLGWTGNFRFTFEEDNLGQLRVIAGINPYASQYPIGKGETFKTPEFIFTLSSEGKGLASRRFHDWARKYSLRFGDKSRMTLLNNWEATYFDFNEEKLLSLIGEAKELGVDMFLLDDGWFANKYPRHSDTQGLGDWTETKDKLPNGIGRLTEEAKKQGIKFGMWIEPEMVNPKSELYEKHKDWVITLPNRKEYYFRNQLVLDLANPKVQDHVFGVVDGLMTKYPDIAFFKWDCNSPITNIYSNWEKTQQSKMYIDYVRGLYNVLERVKAKYPDLVMMMCAGGGGRSDYEGLKYFDEFWCSDNTDPVERLYIQWGYSQVFPAKAMCAHVTTWNKNVPVKFRTDVAMMAKMGFDINLHDLNADELKFCKNAIKEYNRLKPVILDGDQYRLMSPYTNTHTATIYTAKDKQSAVLFACDLFPRYGDHRTYLKLQGLNPNLKYAVTEINRADASTENVGEYTGDYLMKVGINVFTGNKLSSRIYELKVK